MPGSCTAGLITSGCSTTAAHPRLRSRRDGVYIRSGGIYQMPPLCFIMLQLSLRLLLVLLAQGKAVG